MARLLAQAASPSVQASSPSAQGKAAAAQVGDRNWNWRKNLSCPTIRVIKVICALLLSVRNRWVNALPIPGLSPTLGHSRLIRSDQ